MDKINAEYRVAMFSGGPIENFTGGWAKLCFVGEKPHYWRDDTEALKKQLTPDLLESLPADVRFYRSLCGVFGTSADKTPPLGAGNFPPCKRCMKKAPTWPNKEQRTTIYESDPRVRGIFRRG
ncbi:hypothetical protein [Dyella sp.]|uniref:hypothetical protein n=1 Tax=Dyella sp. TaxID=1869338 RepID=UPI002FD8DA77